MGSIPTRDTLLQLLSIEENVLQRYYANEAVYAVRFMQEERVNALRELLIHTDQHPEFTDPETAAG